jgi:hypothetical protein
MKQKGEKIYVVRWKKSLGKVFAGFAGWVGIKPYPGSHGHHTG